MTFCLGMKVREGLVGIADTRVTTGAECITVQKVTIRQFERNSMFLMTSGLRSTRDKAVTYFEEIVEEDWNFDRLYKVANAFGAQVRRVADEDQQALSRSGLFFDLHTLVGGQLENDKEHKLYLIYPQGNWVEISGEPPYHIIGLSAFGKPLLDFGLDYEAELEYALKIGYLAFEATRTSANEVDFPLDVVLYRKNSFEIVEHRFEEHELTEVSNWWRNHVRDSVRRLPSDWIDKFFSKVGRHASDRAGSSA